MITSYNFYFCHIEIYEDYVKAIMKEGITVLPEHNDVLLLITEKHFKNKPFVYITHRINSYAVNPTVYLETAKIPNVIGFAVVSADHRQKIQTKLEKAFFNKEFKQFDTLELALKWKDQMIKKYSDQKIV
ncbi:hypothetical protein ATO12_04355 [Aquimarina atlantica]|uniref:STAS/SEC14 domain-containing protein n=1 Tax=Aquimarina atlantica TaxID=1317122 RepID=A0A023C296_9FLAO|nr:STAS/SEC14 domain-containing protein [Aquimarina atlantica]EZH76028.1 hypothetical protein ATO12_04355 [Aquimarina atlantica]